MNLYGILIVVSLVTVFVVELAAKLLNLKMLSPELPGEFKGFFDPDKYQRTIEYTRARIWFDVASSTFSLSVLLVFWWIGGFVALDTSVRALRWPPLVSGLVFVGVLLVASDLLSLPFQIYSTFVIEARFGFNRMTWKTFLLDRIKGYLLAGLIGGAFLAAILVFFQRVGPSGWVHAWVAACFFKFGLALIAPTYILPLFNKFTPLPEGDLRKAIFDYAKSVNYPLRNIFVMDGSKRSSKTNAFFTGFGKNKRIALFDTLIEKHTVQELVSIMAHEIGHYKLGHVMKTLVFSVFYYGFVFFLLSLFISRAELFAAFGMKNMSVYAGLVFFGIVYTPLSFLLSTVQLAISRRHEYEADRYAVETISDPEWSIGSLKKLAVSNFANLTPHPFYVALEYSHPPILKRIEAIRAVSQTH